MTGTPFPVRSHRHAVPVATRRPYVARRQNRRASGPTTLQARAGLLNFFLPPKQSTNKQGQAQLVNDILRLASQTNSGANASQEQRQEITQLVRNMPVGTAGNHIKPLESVGHASACLRLNNSKKPAV